MSYTKEEKKIISPIRKRIFKNKIKNGTLACATCGKTTGRFELDHITPLQFGGHLTDKDNLQILCRACHISKTTKENFPNRKPLHTNGEILKWKDFIKTI